MPPAPPTIPPPTSALVSLAATKSWLRVTTTDDDAFLTLLIKQISIAIYRYVQRPDFKRTTFTEVQSGVGGQRLMLRNWPVLSVSSVSVDGVGISEAASPQYPGWSFDAWDGAGSGKPQLLCLNQRSFNRGNNNISVTYDAGYAVQNEAQTIDIGRITPYQLQGLWAQDDGVYGADGERWERVAFDPMESQYTIDETGLYEFFNADEGKTVTLNYSYIPYDIAEACMEWVAERYRYKDRIGQTSKTLGGQETTAYAIKGVPDFVAQILAPYRKVFAL